MGTRPWGLLAALAISACVAMAIHAWLHGASSFQPAAGLPTPAGNRSGTRWSTGASGHQAGETSVLIWRATAAALREAVESGSKAGAQAALLFPSNWSMARPACEWCAAVRRRSPFAAIRVGQARIPGPIGGDFGRWDDDEASPGSAPDTEEDRAFGLSDEEAGVAEANRNVAEGAEAEMIGEIMPAYDAVLSEEQLVLWRAAESRFQLKAPRRRAVVVTAAEPAPE